MIIQSVKLFYQEGSSDKVYHMQLSQDVTGYQVACQWGRRGNTLQSGLKCDGVTLVEADRVFDKVWKEKIGKGYQDYGGDDVDVGYTTPAPAVAVEERVRVVSPSIKKRKVIFDAPVLNKVVQEVRIPQLLNPIDESELERYLRDDNWGGQEKKDGKHNILVCVDGAVKVYNKKGIEIGYPSHWHVPSDMVLDGEAIGDNLYVYDALMMGGKDLKCQTYEERYRYLCSMVESNRSGLLVSKAAVDEWFSSKPVDGGIRLVPLAVGYEAKKALYDYLMASKKEGIVFKRLDSTFTSGKAHQDMVKLKFYAECSVRVCGGRVGKHSIGMELHEGGAWRGVGNCTLPPSVPKMALGTVVEIRYLYAYPGGALYQPTYKGIRDDVDAYECVIEQLKYKSEED